MAAFPTSRKPWRSNHPRRSSHVVAAGQMMMGGRMAVVVPGCVPPVPGAAADTMTTPRDANQARTAQIFSPDGANRRCSMLCKPLCPSARLEGRESCGACTKQEVWTAFDAFLAMDKRGVRKVGRQDFFDALKSKDLSIDQIKIVRRASLQSRFRESAAEVTVEELLQLLWPRADAEDLRKMQNWVHLREARMVLREQNFRADRSDLRRIFSLLDDDGNGNLSVRELLRAHILSQEELAELMGAVSVDDGISFVQFVELCEGHFKARYVSSFVRKTVEQEKQQAVGDEFQRNVKDMGKRRTAMFQPLSRGPSLHDEADGHRSSQNPSKSPGNRRRPSKEYRRPSKEVRRHEE